MPDRAHAELPIRVSGPRMHGCSYVLATLVAVATRFASTLVEGVERRRVLDRCGGRSGGELRSATSSRSISGIACDLILPNAQTTVSAASKVKNRNGCRAVSTHIPAQRPHLLNLAGHRDDYLNRNSAPEGCFISSHASSTTTSCGRRIAGSDTLCLPKCHPCMSDACHAVRLPVRSRHPQSRLGGPANRRVRRAGRARALLESASWCTSQRFRHRPGLLSPGRRAALDR